MAGQNLKLYNTLTRKKEDFTPIDPSRVRLYVCGPTVYDFAHIGNARPVIVFDVLFRLLRHVYGKENVVYARNITDVDDKINARALRDYPDLPLNEAIRKVTEKTANQFHDDVRALGCLEPTHEPRATEHIEGMKQMAQVLIDKGRAYIAEGSEGHEVLFDVRAMPDYGQLSNRKLEDQQAGARVDVKDHKKNPGDFVLWKESNENEPGWDAEYSDGDKAVAIRGRPGWHIECSVMSRHHLGEVFDIHAGGLDLIFPHHENEIAQSRCAHGTDVMANIWMHNGYLQVEGKKMSKSEGNFVTIYDLLHTEKFGGRKWPGEVLRLAMLMTNYREPIDFSVKRLVEAENILDSFIRIKKQVSDRDPQYTGNIFSKPVMPESIAKPLCDDLNSSDAIRALQAMAKAANTDDNSASEELLHGAASLGFELQESAIEAGVEESEIQEKIEARLACLNSKNFDEADKIRSELASQGIQLKDSKDSETGERITTWEVKR